MGSSQSAGTRGGVRVFGSRRGSPVHSLEVAEVHFATDVALPVRRVVVGHYPQ